MIEERVWTKKKTGVSTTAVIYEVRIVFTLVKELLNSLLIEKTNLIP